MLPCCSQGVVCTGCSLTSVQIMASLHTSLFVCLCLSLFVSVCLSVVVVVDGGGGGGSGGSSVGGDGSGGGGGGGGVCVGEGVRKGGRKCVRASVACFCP